MSNPPPDSEISIQEVLETLSNTSSLRQKRNSLTSLEARSEELALLGKSLLEAFKQDSEAWEAGAILQIMFKNQPDALKQFLIDWPNGWFFADSAAGINYSYLQETLLAENFEEADRFTSSILRKLAGQQAEERGYVYFSEVANFNEVDLISLDRLWKVYSQARFGFSVQGRLLDSLNGNYEKLWKRIGWKVEGVWTRYPKAFTWSMDAPEGHMPLVNQLRGVRLMDAILNHPALLTRR